jgi:HAMP domain-containing protein
MASQTETALLELNGKFERMMDNIEIVKDKQEEMALDIVKIKEAVYNPDSGIYARIRELESFKRQVSKMLWIIVTTLVGLGMHQVLSSVG